MATPKYRYQIQFRQGETPNGLVVYGFTVGSDTNKSWDSNLVKSVPEIDSLMNRVSGGRELNIAVPKLFSMYFVASVTQFEELDILIGESRNPNIYSNLTQRIVLKNVAVLKIQPIPKRNGLERPPDNIWKFLTTRYGEAGTEPLMVTLFITNGESYVEGDMFSDDRPAY